MRRVSGWVKVLGFMLVGVGAVGGGGEALAEQMEYKLLATKKTSTMLTEMNEAAAEGYRFQDVMGGETIGGSEVVVIMGRDAGNTTQSAEYELLATSKTSTMQKELSEAATRGFEYREQTVFSSTFGGDEVMVFLERDTERGTQRYEYLLLGTKKTSTMQKELSEVAAQGYALIGMTVAPTAFAGNELVCILQRRLASE